MKIIPVSLADANAFVDEYHRHNKPVVGHKFSIGLEMDGQLAGVAIVGRPVARMLDNGRTLEVLRVCVKNGYKNANSKLYARCARIARLMGYESLITYTLQEESGSSLRAVGARVVHYQDRLRSWDTPSRRRDDQEVYFKRKILTI